MKLLIAYGTTEGQTRKICTFLKEEAEKAGHSVRLVDTTLEQPSPAEFEAAIVAASVHTGSYQTAVEHYVKEHNEALKKIPSAFISVSLTAAGDDKESWKDLEEITNKFLKESGWQPKVVEQVAGALLYSKYNFFKKFIMRMIARQSGGSTDTSTDTEYTDWEQVKGILEKLK